ncbi:MAG: MBL fold metallo-hydrolase [Spirochaetota bacterium]
MRITVLGSCGGFAGRNEGCSSYLLSLEDPRSREDRHFLIDAGPGAVAFVQNYTPLHRLDGIILSHLHPDHVSDLFTLRYALQSALRMGELAAPLPLYLPRTPEKSFSFLRDCLGEELEPRLLQDGGEIDLGGARVLLLQTLHPLECYAMRLEAGVAAAVYTADTGFFAGLVDFARGADLLIAEATLLDADRELEAMGHMTARTAGELACAAGAGRLWLTHIWPFNDRSLTEAQARESCPVPLQAARRGLSATLGDPGS